jgi:hypothetical protein
MDDDVAVAYLKIFRLSFEGKELNQKLHVRTPNSPADIPTGNSRVKP